MRWGAISLVLLSSFSVRASPRSIESAVVLISYAAFRTIFPIRTDAPLVRQATAFAGESALCLVAVALCGGWGTPAVLMLGGAQLTAGLTGGIWCVASGSALVAVSGVGWLILAGGVAGALGTVERTIFVAVAGVVGAYGRRLEGDAIRRVGDVTSRRSVADERARIARELHDRVGQSIAVVTLALDRLATTWAASDPQTRERSMVELDQLARDVRSASEEVRAQLRELHDSDHARTDVPGEIACLLRRVAARSEIVTSFTNEYLGGLSTDRAEELWQIAKEAIVNAERHARATHLTVHWTGNDHGATLEIVDDGMGFDSTGDGTFGLAGMRERAKRFGGALEVVSIVGQGTTVRVRHGGPLG
jgi:signal transduction histidine kinase